MLEVSEPVSDLVLVVRDVVMLGLLLDNFVLAEDTNIVARR